IETIGVQPDVVPRDQMSKLAKLIEGTSLLTLDVERMDKEWREKLTSVTVFEIINKYPQTLEVRYTPRAAYSQLASPDGVFLADRNGYIFAEASSTALPKLTTDASVSEVGKTASAEGIMLGMYLIKGLRNTTPRLQSIVLEEGQLEVKLASSTLILINEERDAVPTTEQIQTLLAKFEQDKKYPKEIDMRFDRPVLRY